MHAVWHRHCVICLDGVWVCMPCGIDIVREEKEHGSTEGEE
jgi:hypothetical protein